MDRHFGKKIVISYRAWAVRGLVQMGLSGPLVSDAAIASLPGQGRVDLQVPVNPKKKSFEQTKF